MPWKTILIGAVVVGLLVYAPSSTAHVVHEVFHGIGVFLSSLGTH